MSSWGCPHDVNGICQRIPGALCDPGMRGCILFGKVEISGPQGEAPRRPVRATAEDLARAQAPRKRRSRL